MEKRNSTMRADILQIIEPFCRQSGGTEGSFRNAQAATSRYKAAQGHTNLKILCAREKLGSEKERLKTAQGATSRIKAV
jgi:hypothetical protein